MENDDKSEVIDGGKPEEKTDDKDGFNALSDADGVVIDDGGKLDIEDDKKTKTIEEPEKKTKEEKKDDPDYKSLYEQIRKDKNDLKKALHEARQERKSKKEEDSEAVLSDAELMQIIKEHKDDPAVMMNAMKYMVQQQVKGVKKEAVNEIEVSEKNRQFDTILRERYSDYDDDDSPISFLRFGCGKFSFSSGLYRIRNAWLFPSAIPITHRTCRLFQQCSCCRGELLSHL